MCMCGMHFTNSLRGRGVGCGGYMVVDTHNWRHEHVQRDSNLEIKKQQMGAGSTWMG